VPGHSRGAIAYLVEGRDGRYLFSGDIVFSDGRISLLNCRGSSLADYREHIGRLARLRADALFPGHGAFCLHGGQAHLDRAVTALHTSIYPPPNLR